MNINGVRDAKTDDEDKPNGIALSSIIKLCFLVASYHTTWLYLVTKWFLKEL